MIVRGNLPAWFYVAHSFAKLVPLVKAEPRPGETPDVRPVMVGTAPSRAIETALTRAYASAFADYLCPQQVAVGMPGGISVMNWGLHTLMRWRTDFVLIKIDLRNAYNVICRATCLRRLAAASPRLRELVRYMHALYGGFSDMQIDDRDSLFDTSAGRDGDSEDGWHQGRGLSGPVFCVGIHPEVQELDAALQPYGVSVDLPGALLAEEAQAGVQR